MNDIALKKAFLVVRLIALLVFSTVAVLLSFNESLRDGIVALVVIYLLITIYETLDRIASAIDKIVSAKEKK